MWAWGSNLTEGGTKSIQLLRHWGRRPTTGEKILNKGLPRLGKEAMARVACAMRKKKESNLGHGHEIGKEPKCHLG